MPVTTFFQILSTLFSNYWSIGWPFLLIHLAIGVFFVWKYWSFWHEIQELGRWEPGHPGSHHPPAMILQQFSVESESAGQIGIFVPMTDYSDRLDAHVDGEIDSLHSLVNMFLVVGVAGTFFALFRFASAVKDGLPADQIGLRLSEGLANAFPIGFVGLLLTIGGHFGIHFAEGYLRQALDRAARAALSRRAAFGTTVVSQIAEAMEPLKNLETTLSQSLRPVIEGFQKHLQETQKYMVEQVQPLTTAVSHLQATVDKMDSSATSLNKTTEQFPALLQEAASIQSRSLAVIERTGEIVARWEPLVKGAADSLTGAAKDLAQVPGQLSLQFGEALTQMASHSAQVVHDATERFFNGLEPGVARLAKASGNLEDAAAGLCAVPERVGAAMTAVIHSTQQEIEGVKDAFKTGIEDLSNKAYEAWMDNAAKFINDLNGATKEHLDKVARASDDSAKSMREAANALIDTSNRYRSDLATLVPGLMKQVQSDLQPYLRQLDEAIVLRYPAALESIRQAQEETGKFSTSLGQVYVQMVTLRSTAEGLSQDIQKARGEWNQLQSPGSGLMREVQKTNEILEIVRTKFAELPRDIAASMPKSTPSAGSFWHSMFSRKR
jgi:ABC-type transporter Mla subunit MlaD